MLKCVLQATQPWISTEDIEKGSIWFGEISQQLKETSVGIICLTRENLDARWILFEAGGLAKGITQNRVCTLLVDIADTEVKPPLSLFNSTKSTKEDMFKLFQSINGFLGDKALVPDILKKSFDRAWPEFESEYNAALKSHSSKTRPVKRSIEEIADEILQISRDVQRQLQQQPLPSNPVNSDYLKSLTKFWSQPTPESDFWKLIRDTLKSGSENEEEVITDIIKPKKSPPKPKS